ncbi:hypothetical protein PpBr36_07855 [Pyricularia pennisetigena]|uniref:hypothetical protein n=1 Tax=Pyricularia pennisetigena TaxID=1578925 RepID=UPI00114FDA0D|nr:hypothetical protein PpBr36_07855 [Pyricularia pennisetigena]TLS25996.1 hypothetical protein PpBr36_07855 [Pyricularia pennisetigena]
MPGGVCAVLDYDVEMMAEYVASMATRLTLGNVPVSPPFQKFVSQILTSTRLPSTTILLGMNYMAKRINSMAQRQGEPPKFNDGQVWRMLTTAFLLGSKFLDDNTFQNKSWSEVSAIPVQELNTLEMEWLAAMDWQLYVNLDSTADYTAWLTSWAQWKEDKERQKAAERAAARERHMPVVPRIDTDVFAFHNPAWRQQQVAEYERLQSLNQKRTELSPPSSVSAHNSWYSERPMTWGHPLTPPDSGYGTPDYSINSAASHSAQYNEWFARGIAFNNYGPSRQPGYQYPNSHRNSYQNVCHSARQPASAHPGYYGCNHGYHNNIWDANNMDCSSCTASTHNKSMLHFGMPHTHGFGQPVMG